MDHVDWKARGSTVREGSDEVEWLTKPKAGLNRPDVAAYLKPPTKGEWKSAMRGYEKKMEREHGMPPRRPRFPALAWVLRVLRALNPLRWL